MSGSAFLPQETREVPAEVVEKIDQGHNSTEPPRYQRGLIVLHRLSTAKEMLIKFGFGFVGLALGLAVGHFAPVLIVGVVALLGAALVAFQGAYLLKWKRESTKIIKKMDEGIKIIEPRERGIQIPKSKSESEQPA